MTGLENLTNLEELYIADNGLTHLKGLQMNNLHTIEIANNNVIQLYIRVFVVLTWHYCRKESQKLDINLDREQCHCSVCLQSLGNSVTMYFFKVY